jgi:hypothetical protein
MLAQAVGDLNEKLGTSWIHLNPSEPKARNRRWTPMNADSFEKETASARSDTQQAVTSEAQTPKVEVLLFPAFIGVHRRPSAVPEGLGWMQRGPSRKKF